MTHLALIFMACALMQTLGSINALKTPKIAVIGAGIGGASSVHFLTTLFGETGADVDIYEASAVGGRLAVASINGQNYETGGSIIHPKNKYMQDFVKILGLSERYTPEGRFGLYDGKDYIFTESSWEILTYFKLFWRYGRNLLKWHSMIAEILQDFHRIYAIQDQGYAFSSVDKLLAAMNPAFVNMTRMTARHYLRQKDFSDDFIDELFMAITRVNYGQTPDINAFVGAVSLAGAQPGLWAVKGGNRLVPELLLKNAKVDAISGLVKEIQLQNEKFKLLYEKPNSQMNKNNETLPTKPTSGRVYGEKTYDLVILTAPLIKEMSNISFKDFQPPIKHFDGDYHHTVCTLVRGDINATYLHMTTKLDDILTTSADAPFNSLATVYPVDCEVDQSLPPKVWKIFSQEPVTDDQLDSIFVKRDEVHVTDWPAYPHYMPPDNLGPFVLYPGLFYTSSIEWAASAMEMSAIAARNVALLAYNHWHGQQGKLDTSPTTNMHTEL